MSRRLLLWGMRRRHYHSVGDSLSLRKHWPLNRIFEKWNKSKRNCNRLWMLFTKEEVQLCWKKVCYRGRKTGVPQINQILEELLESSQTYAFSHRGKTKEQKHIWPIYELSRNIKVRATLFKIRHSNVIV